MAAAANWYDERSPGLGTEFLRAVETCIASIDRNPVMYAFIYRNIRRALLRRFPYGLFFLFDADCLTIIACLHGKQDHNRLHKQ